MKKILLISDTHGYLDPKVINHAQEADEIWHGGDIGTTLLSDQLKKIRPLKAVYGNIDGNDVRAEFPENNIFTCEGIKVLMTHIGGYPGRYPARIKELIKEHRPGVFICGHSHILKVIFDKENNLLHLNPGACGVHGFHTVKTMLRFEIHQNEVKNLAVIELGKRSSVNS